MYRNDFSTTLYLYFYIDEYIYTYRIDGGGSASPRIHCVWMSVTTRWYTALTDTHLYLFFGLAVAGVWVFFDVPHVAGIPNPLLSPFEKRYR